MAAAAELVARRKVPLRLLDQRDARATSRLDLERALRPVAARAIRPRVAERICFDEVADAHRRMDAGGLDGKLVPCPDLPSRTRPSSLVLRSGNSPAAR